MLIIALQTSYMEIKEIAISSLIVGIIVVLRKTKLRTQQENELWLYYLESCSDKAEHKSPSHSEPLRAQIWNHILTASFWEDQQFNPIEELWSSYIFPDFTQIKQTQSEEWEN